MLHYRINKPQNYNFNNNRLYDAHKIVEIPEEESYTIIP